MWNINCFDIFDQFKINVTDRFINCAGISSCADSSIYSKMKELNSTEINCDGKLSCKNVNLLQYMHNGNSIVINAGYLSMAFSNLIFISNDNNYNYNIFCDGEASCYGINQISSYNNSKINNNYNSINQLYCSLKSCKNIDYIENIQNIYALSPFSIENSIIFSDNSSQSLNVYIYGYYAGFNASIFCLDNHECNIYCGTSGCINLWFYCDDSVSICNVYCNYHTFGDIFANFTNFQPCPNGWSDKGFRGRVIYKNESKIYYYSHYGHTYNAQLSFLMEHIYDIDAIDGYLIDIWKYDG